MSHSINTLMEMQNHQAPPTGGAWAREQAAGASNRYARVSLNDQVEMAAAAGALSAKQYLKVSFALDSGDHDSATRILRKALHKRAEEHPQVMTPQEQIDFDYFARHGDYETAWAIFRRAEARGEQQQSQFAGGFKGDDGNAPPYFPQAQRDPGLQERGLGESTNKGKLDVRRELETGLPPADVPAMAKDWGVEQRMVRALSAGVPQLRGSAAELIDKYSDAELNKILPRLRAESRSRWLGRVRAKVAADQAAASRREMLERSKSTGTSAVGHRQAQALVRAR